MEKEVQKEGNGSVHMGFALSDISPKGITSEKYFIIKRDKNGGNKGIKEHNSPLDIGTTGRNVDNRHKALAVRREVLGKVGDLDSELTCGHEDHGASHLVVGAGGGSSLEN